MLDLIDTSLEAFFRATVPLSAQDVDVSFEPPERDWSAKLTRPTINLFLWDVRRSTDQARTGVEEIERDGRRARRMALPRVELRYFLTAWTSDHGDERALLSGLMRSILAHGELPPTYVAEPLAAQPSPRILLGRTTEERPDVAATLDGQLKVGLTMLLITAVDTDVYTPAGPPVTVAEARLHRLDGTGGDLPLRRVAGEIDDPAAVGATVISPRGTATVNAAGRFVIAARAGDELVIETVPPRRVAVPLEGGVRLP